jgi:hypothetical protein
MARCAAGTAALGGGAERPPGLVTARFFSSLAPRQPPVERDDGMG